MENGTFAPQSVDPNQLASEKFYAGLWKDFSS